MGKLCCVFLVGSLFSLCHGYLNANGAANLSAKCDFECVGCKGNWYTYDTTDAAQRCLLRTPTMPTYYTFDFTCHLPDHMSTIRDAESCKDVLGANPLKPKYHQLDHAHLGVISMNYSNTSGCRIQARGSEFFGLSLIQSRVCFGVRRANYVFMSQIAAILIGIFFGLGSTFFEGNPAKSGETGAACNFLPGARMVAKNTLVAPHRLIYVQFYRSCQVIANLWLPFTLLWMTSPYLVFSLYFVLYFIPAWCAAGMEVFKEPRHWISPPRCSLFGIRGDQNAAVWSYLFSIVRPLLLVGGVYGIGYAIIAIGRARGHDDADISTWVTNSSGYFHGALNERWGMVVIYFTVSVTLIGTLLHMILSLPVVIKSLMNSPYNGELITLEEDADLYAEITELTQKISDAAAADVKEDKDRVDALGVKTLSMPAVLWGFALALIDFGAYMYKIVTFLRDARYVLAFCMTVACVEAITVLLYHGYFSKVAKSIKYTASSGIPSASCLALWQWDDGMAGIPSLMLSVYGLPLARPSPLSAISAMIFLLTGTRALACYLGDVSDAGMYDDDAGGVLDTIESEAAEESEDDEDQGFLS